MLHRFVRLTFRPEEVANFLELFQEVKNKIIQQEGCTHLKLLQDEIHENVLYTFSIWQSDDHLQQYRHSQLFKETWARTKVLFGDKPSAWSTTLIEEVACN